MLRCCVAAPAPEAAEKGEGGATERFVPLEALRAHEETRRTLAPEEGRRGEGGGDEGEDGDGGLGGFFLDVTPGDERAEVERAAALAEALGASDAGAGLRGDALDAEEEADLAAMLARNRVALGIGGGGGGEGDVLAGLEREEETLEREGMMMRRGTGGVFQLLFCAHPPRDALDSQRVRRGIRRPSASSPKPSYASKKLGT